MTTDPRRILLTGGRAPAALHLARLLHAEGHRVFAAESLAHPLIRFSSAVEKSFRVPEPNAGPEAYVRALADIVGRHSIDALVPACEEIFHIARARSLLPKECRVFCADAETLERLHRKDAFIASLEAHGFAVPRTRRADSREALDRLLNEAPAGRYVLKPVFSRFAAEVRFIDLPAAARNGICAKIAAEVPVRAGRPWVLQEFLSGREFCSYSIAVGGRLRAHAAYPRRYTAGAGACVHFEAAEAPGIREWVREFVRREGFTGQIAFDFIETARGLYAVECNPRATSGLHLFGPADRLGRAIFEEDGETVEPSAKRARMLALPMLMYGWRSREPGWARAFATSPDAIFEARDPLPFFHQPWLLAELWRRGRERDLTLAQAATADIEWNGGEA